MSRGAQTHGRDGASAPAVALHDAARALLPADEAIRKQLRLLAELGPLREVSLWTLDESDRLRRAGYARGAPTKGVRDVARRVLHGRPTPPGPRRALVGLAFGDPEAPAGALAARVPPGRSAEALALFVEAAPLIAFVLEREAVQAARERQESVLVATERRLARFGLDLHDGPLQDVAALLSDLRLFAGQLESELAEHERGGLLVGRAQDLELRALALEAQLRELSRTAGVSGALEGSVRDALRAEARAFAQATGVVPSLEVTGPVDESTPSQRITLLRGIQEGMRNAREHSGAASVSVRVEAPPGRLEATVEDDGRGFDVARTLSRARRGGRLGLSGIAARARLVGGTCTINSRPGGPTTVKLSLPRWTGGEAPPSVMP